MEEFVRNIAARLIAPGTGGSAASGGAAIAAAVLGGALILAAVVFLTLGLFWGLEPTTGTAGAALITGAAALFLVGAGGLVAWIAEQRRRLAEARAHEARANADLSSLGFELGQQLGRDMPRSAVPILAAGALAGLYLWQRTNAAPKPGGREQSGADSESDEAAARESGGTDRTEGRRGNGEAKAF